MEIGEQRRRGGGDDVACFVSNIHILNMEANFFEGGVC